MSTKEAKYLSAIDKLLQGSINNRQAAAYCGISMRQVKRLKKKARETGLKSILHGNRVHKPLHAISDETRKKILNLYTEKYQDFNFKHFQAKLDETEKITVSYSTIERALKSNGIKSPRSIRRPAKHRLRERKSFEGELVQMDASIFDWLSNGSYYHLHGAIDDATGKILALYFEKEENFNGYCELMFQMNERCGLPGRIYVDGRTVFSVPNRLRQLTLEEELAGENPARTQFARAMDTLGVKISIASSPQAKGRIEKLWNTLQDQLVKELRLNGINDIVKANLFLKPFITSYNRKYAKVAKNSTLMYFPKHDLNNLKLILAIHEKRILDNGLSFSYKGEKFVMPVEINHKEIPASPKDVITVVTSSRIGMRVIYKELVVRPVKYTQLKPIVQQKVVINNSEIVGDRLLKPISWRQTNNYLFAGKPKTQQNHGSDSSSEG